MNATAASNRSRADRRRNQARPIAEIEAEAAAIDPSEEVVLDAEGNYTEGNEPQQTAPPELPQTRTIHDEILTFGMLVVEMKKMKLSEGAAVKLIETALTYHINSKALAQQRAPQMPDFGSQTDEDPTE